MRGDCEAGVWEWAGREESQRADSSPSIKGGGAVNMEEIGLEEDMRPKGVMKSTPSPKAAPLVTA